MINQGDKIIVDTFIEPFSIKMVKPIRMTTRDEREEILNRANLNLFQVRARDVIIDLLTDSGTNAMSEAQWSRMLLGDEAYAGASSFYHFQETVERIMGFPYVLPTHQGRGAESVLFSTVLKPGDFIPSNRHFDTTQANILARKGNPIDLVVDEANDPNLAHPFKGNMDLNKLRDFFGRKGSRSVPVGMITITNNSSAGQPVSMDNIVKTAELYHKHGIPFFIDACRFAENAWFIKNHESGFANKSVREIVRDIFSLADGCLMSAKKDAISNIGGFIALRDRELWERLAQTLILKEGFVTYGGLAGRDLEAIAQGLDEVLEEDYLNYRIKQTAYLGEQLADEGIPVYKPIGGHAVYINAGEFLPHIPPSNFPGVALANEFYLEGGIRSVEIGSLMFAREDPSTGEKINPELELVRMAIPRRVYTRSHLDYVTEVANNVLRRQNEVRGIRIVESPKFLRHFLAKMEWI